MKRLLCVLLSLVLFLSCGITAYASSDMTLSIKKDNISHDAGSNIFGISMEDISYSLDGGLVSNLVNNGSFEYNDGSCVGWDLANHVTITTDNSMNDNNPSSAIVHLNSESVTIKNFGFTEVFDKSDLADMGFQKGVKYDFSCYVRNVSFEGSIGVYLDSSKNSKNIVQISNSLPQSRWTHLSTTLKADASEDGGLAIVFDGSGDIQLDMVSLVPQNSFGYGSDMWKNTTLRPDLVDRIHDMSPDFIRFPGGCLVEGNSIDTLYNWKDTIGTLDARKQYKSIYCDKDNANYYNNTNAMGYHEYFQLCEDVGAMPVPVVGAGIICQSKNDYTEHIDALNRLNMTDEQWQAYLENERGFLHREKGKIADYTEKIIALGIKEQEDFDKYIDSIAIKPNTDAFTNYAQDILDLIEYANGDALTTYWGALRAANGHEKPFNIEYLQIGSDNFGDVYDRNFAELKKIINKQYPNIKIISSSEDVNTSILDEHIVGDEDYMLQYTDAFDSLDRDSAGAIVGECACYTKFGKGASKNNIRSAVCESAVSVGVEKNSDSATMIALSPSLAKENASSDDKALIWYDSMTSWVSPSYYAQMMFANNTGSKCISTSFNDEDVFSSVTVDENAKVVYIKLVNTSSSAKSINIDLDGFDDISLVSVYSLGHKFKEAYNSNKRQAVAPEESTVDAGASDFNVSLSANSVNVVRVAYGDNDGASLWRAPDTTDVTTRGFVPRSMKVLIVVLTIGFAFGTACGYFAYTRIINKNANPNRNKKNRKRKK